MLDESLALSRQQGARAWGWRATMDLARLMQEQGRAGEARALLQACRDAVSEGHDTMDLQQLERLCQQAGVDEG
jgi:hypothetical protein